MVIKGVGIGRGVAVGPVIRMAAALPEPSDAPRADSVSAESEIERVTKSLAPANADLNRRAEEAANGDGGAKKAGRSDPAGHRHVRLRPGARAEHQHAHRAGQTRRARRAGRLRRRGRDVQGHRRLSGRACGGSARRRPACHRRPDGRSRAGRPGLRHPVRSGRGRPVPGRHRRPRPGQHPRHRHLAGRPDLAHGHSGPCPRHRGRRVRRRRRRPEERRRTVIVNAAESTITTEPSDEQVAAAEAAKAKAAKAKELRGKPGATKDGYHIPLLANVGKPSDRQDRAGVRCGRRRPVPFRVPVHRQRRTAER